MISSASKMFVKSGPCMNRNARRPDSGSSSTFVPVMSDGIRSGVNWIRLKLTSKIFDKELTIRVFANPGTPTSKTWPRVKMDARISSITSLWPITTLESSPTITSRERLNSSSSWLIRSTCVDMTGMPLGVRAGSNLEICDSTATDDL